MCQRVIGPGSVGLNDMGYSSNGSAEDRGMFKCSCKRDLVDLLYLLIVIPFCYFGCC